MTDKEILDLTQDLFQLMKRFPRKFPHKLMLLKAQGMAPSEIELLMMLTMRLESDQKVLTVSELSNLLQITPAAVTHMINPLEERGFVERLSDPNDRRVVIIGMTDKGIEFAQSFVSNAQNKLMGLVTHLGKEDSRIFIQLMNKVIDFMSTAD